MKDYQIFSDSSCDLSADLQKAHNIILIPFYVSFDQTTYFKENLEITNEEFYEKLSHDNVFPKTSLPSVQDYITKFMEAIERGQDILCFCLTQKFSGSYQSAVNAKNILKESHPDCNIQIIDSIQATLGQGLVVLQAAYMKQAGYTLEENAAKIEQLKHTSRIMFTVDTLEYLTKGGRIGKVASLAGTILNLKPLIQLKNGELVPYANVRGHKKALTKVLDMTMEYFDETGESYEDYDFCVAETGNSNVIIELLPLLESSISKKAAYPNQRIGVTIGTNTGPGAFGVAFIKKFNV